MGKISDTLLQLFGAKPSNQAEMTFTDITNKNEKEQQTLTLAQINPVLKTNVKPENGPEEAKQETAESKVVSDKWNLWSSTEKKSIKDMIVKEGDCLGCKLVTSGLFFLFGTYCFYRIFSIVPKGMQRRPILYKGYFTLLGVGKYSTYFCLICPTNFKNC